MSGMIEGALAEGEARGERQKAIEIALELMALGVAGHIIAKASGFDESEILKLKNEHPKN